MIKIIKKFNNEKIKIAILFIVLIIGLFLNAFEITNAAFRHEINYQGKLTDANSQAVADDTYDMIFKLYNVAEGGSAIYTEDWNDVTPTTFISTINDGTPPLTSDSYPLAFTYTHHASETTLAVGQILYNLTKKDNVNITAVATSTDILTISKVSTNWANSDSITTRPMTKDGLFSVMVGTLTSLSSVNFNQDLWLGVTIESDSEMTPRKKLGAVPAAFEAYKLNGIVSDSFLRSDEPDTMSSSSASSILTVTQEGAGASAQFGDGTDYVQIDKSGNIVFTNAAGSSITGPSAGTLAISAGASQALNLTGNAASTWKTTSGALTIQSAGAFTATSTGIMTFGTNNNPRMTILTDGKVGIGATSPGALLQIEQSSAKTDVAKASMYLLLGEEESALNAYYAIGFGYNSTATYMPSYIGYKTTSSASAEKGALVFGTRNVVTDTAPSERMRINPDGNIGIATSTPSSKLTIDGDGDIIQLLVQGHSTQTSDLVVFEQSNGTDLFTIDGSGNTAFGIAAATSTITGGMNVDSNTLFVDAYDNRVGIGTASPHRKLSVSGDAVIEDNLISTQDNGIYFGRTRLSENQWAVYNPGDTWTAKDSSRNWWGIAISSDGKYQTAAVNNGNIYISSDYGATWTAKDSVRNWYDVAMSSDGKYQTAVTSINIYISSDYGATWTAKGSVGYWYCIAMSSDGKYQTAAVAGGDIYISSDYGATWTAKDSTDRDWYDVAMSSDGKYQTAVVYSGDIYISSDYGATWTIKDDTNRNWYGIAISSDGKYQTATAWNHYIYISSDYGATWTAKDSVRYWYGIAISSDGKYQTATVEGGDIYISSDYGATWTIKDDTNRNWYGIAISSDGKYQTAIANGGNIYVSYADSITHGNVGIGTAAPSSKLTIDGDGDITQLLVQGHSAQTSDLVVFEQSNGTDLFTIDGSGNTTFGLANATSTITGGMNVDSNTLFVDAYDNRVGIGTATPNTTLDINGTIDYKGWHDYGLLAASTGYSMEGLTVWNGMLCMNTDGTNLPIKCYDGSTWNEYGALSDSNSNLTVWNGELCAGDYNGNIKCYDGSTLNDYGSLPDSIYSLTVWKGMLCAGDGSGNVRCYDGSIWNDYGDIGSAVWALTVWNGMLCEGNHNGYVKCYDGSAWNSYGDLGSYNLALTVWNNNLCAAGDHNNGIKCHDGSAWNNTGYSASYNIRGLTVWNGMLCAGDDGGAVRCYNENSWTSFGTPANDYIEEMTVWNGMLCQSGLDSHVRCYQNAFLNNRYWSKNGDTLAWNRIVEIGDLNVTGNVGIGDTSPSARLSVVESSGQLVDFTHGSTHMLTILDEWRTRFATSSVAYFGSLNDRIVDNMEATTLDWTQNTNTSTSTESTSIFKVGKQALKITSTCSSDDETVSKDWTAESWTSYERLGFWIYADKIATSTATTTQIISAQLHNTDANATSTHNITIQAEDEWQYEEWNLSEITDRDHIDRMSFRMDANIAANIYIDHIRLYNEDERGGEFFVDASGNLNLFSPNEIEFTRAVPGGSLPSMKLGSAIVEVNQPFAVNVPGDVGINYDLYFAGPGLSQITSAGPMRISAGDSNHAENLTLTTGGKGDIIIDIADSRFGLKTIGNSNLAYVNRLYPEGELELRNTLYSDMKFVDAAYRYATTSDTWTTTTDEINSYQGEATTLLNVNDYFYWGATSTDGFSRLYFDFATVAIPSLTLIWEYSTSTDSIHSTAIDWPNLQGTTTTDDTADHFTSDGNIDWTIPGDWGVSQLGDAPADIGDYYWIRVHTSTAITTPPTAYFAGLSRYGGDFARFTTDGTDKFRIDKDGDIYVAGKIGVATANASTTAHIISTSEQLRLGQNVAKYSQFKTDSTGDLHITATGHDIEMADDNLWVCAGGSIDSSSCPAFSVSGNGNLAIEDELFVGPDTSNYLKISGTEITYTGTAKPKRSIILTAAGAITKTSNGPAQTKIDGTNHTYYVLDYNDTTDESAFWQWTMPDSYDNGTVDITYYWEAAATSGNVAWCFQAKGISANTSENIDLALSSEVCEEDTANADANDLYSITESSATSNFTAGEYVTFKVFRNADNLTPVTTDSLTGDARLVKVKIEYSVNKESD